MKADKIYINGNIFTVNEMMIGLRLWPSEVMK